MKKINAQSDLCMCWCDTCVGMLYVHNNETANLSQSLYYVPIKLAVASSRITTHLYLTYGPVLHSIANRACCILKDTHGVVNSILSIVTIDAYELNENSRKIMQYDSMGSVTYWHRLPPR